ncbi:jing interacting gene regulatory 1 [Haematobia irritans]|uniref:jing interacting gene regulatory 1 n=1 Tax=Haematobia irritans TaxID=7368 RepID=UPI003F50842C
MGEFDISLIEEFRLRESLYDRNSAQFKDKLYNAQQWQEISNKLGYDVSILKDRMLQLRNRYNLEKRRMEQLREETGKLHESPWALYDRLQFLSGHIKARRRYKSMIPITNHKDDSQMNDSGNDYSTMDDSAMIDGGDKDDMSQGVNGLFNVKVEENLSEGHDSEPDIGSSRSENFANSLPVMTQIHSPTDQYRLTDQRLQRQHHHSQTEILPTRIIRQLGNSNQPTISVRNDIIMNPKHEQKRSSIAPIPVSLKRPYENNNNNNNNNSRNGITTNNNCNNKQIRLSPRENKYTAFGTFVSSSLLDLPQKMALELVEKFTSDIVKALTMKIDNQEANAAAAAAAADSENAQQREHQEEEHDDDSHEE